MTFVYLHAINIYYLIVINIKCMYVDTAFRLMRFPLDDELDFYFEKNDFLLIKKNDLESPLVFVLFKKGKQNMKENPKCDSLFWKR